MKLENDNNLRKLLLMYEVEEPSLELVVETKRLMHEELNQLSTAPSLQAKWVVMLVGLAFVMAMCLFYTFTVGTILSFTLPANIAELLHYTLYAFTAAGGIFVAGVLMIFYFKQLSVPRLEMSSY